MDKRTEEALRREIQLRRGKSWVIKRVAEMGKAKLQRGKDETIYAIVDDLQDKEI